MQDDQLQFFFLPNRLPVRGLRPWQAFLLRQASLSRRRSLAISSILTYYTPVAAHSCARSSPSVGYAMAAQMSRPCVSGNRPNICVIAESRDSQRVAVPVFRSALRVSMGEKRGLAPAKRVKRAKTCLSPLFGCTTRSLERLLFRARPHFAQGAARQHTAILVCYAADASAFLLRASRRTAPGAPASRYNMTEECRMLTIRGRGSFGLKPSSVNEMPGGP